MYGPQTSGQNVLAVVGEKRGAHGRVEVDANQARRGGDVGGDVAFWAGGGKNLLAGRSIAVVLEGVKAKLEPDEEHKRKHWEDKLEQMEKGENIKGFFNVMELSMDKLKGLSPKDSSYYYEYAMRLASNLGVKVFKKNWEQGESVEQEVFDQIKMFVFNMYEMVKVQADKQSAWKLLDRAEYMSLYRWCYTCGHLAMAKEWLKPAREYFDKSQAYGDKKFDKGRTDYLMHLEELYTEKGWMKLTFTSCLEEVGKLTSWLLLDLDDGKLGYLGCGIGLYRCYKMALCSALINGKKHTAQHYSGLLKLMMDNPEYGALFGDECILYKDAQRLGAYVGKMLEPGVKDLSVELSQMFD